MNTPIDERETLDGFAAEDVSPISAGLLREAGGDIDMQEAAQAALRAALDRDGGGGVRERGAGTGMKEALQDADTEAAAATRRLFEKKNPRNSPEKKARPEVPSAASAKVGAPGLQAPPVFGGPRPPPKDKRSLPDAYDISDAAPPPWAQDLQHSLMRLDKGQQDTLEQLHVTHKSLRDKMQTLETRQDAQLERTEAFEARLSALENEVRDLRSRSPSLASGSVSPRNTRDSNHDDWQVALGGWYEAKREAIEEEVRAWFSRAECLPLLQDLHIGGVRANSCRVDLRYMQSSLRERRQVQNLCVEALRAAARTSDIPGQQGGYALGKA